MALNAKPNFRFIWGLLMVAIYFCMFFLLVFTSLFGNIPSTFRIVLGVIFLVYGLYRGYSVWKYGR